MQNLFNMTSKFGSGFCCAWCQGSEPSDCLGPIAPYSAHGNNSSSSRKCIAGNKGIEINRILKNFSKMLLGFHEDIGRMLLGNLGPRRS